MIANNEFASAVVAVCGLGGLGSNIASMLARIGIGKIIIIDFDKVDESNIYRQYYKTSQVGLYKTKALYENLREINEGIIIECYTTIVSEDNASKLLKEAHIVCEAFDNPQQKAMLTNYVLEKMPEKYLVASSGLAGILSANTIKTRKITDRFYICGDGVSGVDDLGKLVATRAMLCAAHQAHTVLRILNKEFEV